MTRVRCRRRRPSAPTRLLASYRAAADDGFEGTDTAACIAAYADVPVVAVPSTSLNLKVTFPEDVALATELSPDPPADAVASVVRRV